jgi:hypothetical protein
MSLTNRTTAHPLETVHSRTIVVKSLASLANGRTGELTQSENRHAQYPALCTVAHKMSKRAVAAIFVSYQRNKSHCATVHGFSGGDGFAFFSIFLTRLDVRARSLLLESVQ